MDISPTEVKRAASAQPSYSPSPGGAQPPVESNGSEILVKCLQAENVRFLWGYPGGAVLYIYKAPLAMRFPELSNEFAQR